MNPDDILSAITPAINERIHVEAQAAAVKATAEVKQYMVYAAVGGAIGGAALALLIERYVLGGHRR